MPKPNTPQTKALITKTIAIALISITLTGLFLSIQNSNSATGNNQTIHANGSITPIKEDHYSIIISKFKNQTNEYYQATTNKDTILLTSTDGTHTIQTAIDNLPSERTSMQTIDLGELAYTIKHTITVPNYTIIKNGNLTLANAANCDMFMGSGLTKGTGNSNIKLTNLNMDGNAKGQTGYSSAINFGASSGYFVTNIEISNNIIHDFNEQYWQTQLCAAQNSKYQNNTVYNSRCALQLSWGKNNLVENNNISNYSLIGINLWGTQSHQTVQNNIIQGPGIDTENYGIEIYHDASNCLINNNTIKNTCAAIALRVNSNASYNTISGNTISNVQIGVQAINSNNLKIEGNKISNQSKNADIFLQTVTQSSVTGNNLSNSNYAIDVRYSSSNILISNNTITGYGGLRLSTNSSNLLVTNNFFNVTINSIVIADSSVTGLQLKNNIG